MFSPKILINVMIAWQKTEVKQEYKSENPKAEVKNKSDLYKEKSF